MSHINMALDSPKIYNKWLVLAVLSASLFMINLDVTIVNIALPNIMDKVSASLADAEGF